MLNNNTSNDKFYAELFVIITIAGFIFAGPLITLMASPFIAAICGMLALIDDELRQWRVRQHRKPLGREEP